MGRYSDIEAPKPAELSNYCSIFCCQGRWLPISPYNITYLCITVILWMPPQLKLGIKIYFSFKIFFFIPKNEFPESVKGLFSFYFILLRFFSKKILVPQIPRSADLQSCDARLHSVEPKGHGCACIRHHQAKLIRENPKKKTNQRKRGRWRRWTFWRAIFSIFVLILRAACP